MDGTPLPLWSFISFERCCSSYINPRNDNYETGIERDICQSLKIKQVDPRQCTHVKDKLYPKNSKDTCLQYTNPPQTKVVVHNSTNFPKCGWRNASKTFWGYGKVCKFAHGMGELKEVPVENADRWELIGEVGLMSRGRLMGVTSTGRFAGWFFDI